MAFQLKTKEPVSDGITRNVKNQIEKALGYLSPKVESRRRGAPDYEAAHEIRKCFKRVRAALRMVREDLGDDLYHEENFAFRDAARPLTLVRDADVLIETADKLAEAIEPGVHAKIHEALLANRQEVAHRVLAGNKAFAMVKEAATSALGRLPAWKIERDGWAALETGVRRVYRRGHHALALAVENPSVENLHEWRKQTKYLWHELQLLEAVWTGSGKELVDQTHQLSTLLGEDHDLAVLRQTLAADPLAYGGHRILKDVFAVIDRRRGELGQQAFACGGEIYKDPPRVFASRIGASTNYRRSNEEKQPVQKPAEGIRSRPAVKAGHRQSQTPAARKKRG